MSACRGSATVITSISGTSDRDYLDIRNFYETEEGEWKPTRKGIAIPVELYDELLDALAAAKPKIEERSKAKAE